MSGLLDLLEIRKAYGDTRVLEGVALSLAPGEVVSLARPQWLRQEHPAADRRRTGR
ncbi:hypothetical protein PALA17_01395 [Pseudomonas aeruginosa]|nr:hypothetical protein PALA17_01395 [Pseudomonas aeruginosa]WBJ60276.1 hypothetical protein PALA45_04144 [Pseudomonas aeruginosa]WBJ69793.1 hypothetical protein PALA48_01672 [Pseudomonas aeruginosa]